MNVKRMLTGLSILLLGTAVASAQNTPKPRVIQKGLDNPSGVAVRPNSPDVYIATHQGVMHFKAGRRGENSQLHMEIGGYATDVYGKGPKYNIGPLGLAFMDRQHLVVGDGSRPDGEELVRVYRVRMGEHEQQAEEDAVTTLGPITAGDASARGEGNFYGVAIGAGAIFVTCNGDDTKGWVSRAVIEDGTAKDLTPFIATKTVLDVDAPVAITFTPDGSELVIGQMGEMNIAGDSLLTFYDPKSGELLRQFETGLSDIAGLAYSPTTGKLYCVDFSWVAPEDGGLFELDPSSGKATKIAKLDKPTAMAFDGRGRLYITQYGTAAEGDSDPPGALLRVARGL